MRTHECVHGSTWLHIHAHTHTQIDQRCACCTRVYMCVYISTCMRVSDSDLFSPKLLSISMPGNKLSSHPLETLRGVRGVHGVRNTPALAWIAEELSCRNELMVPYLFRAAGLWRSLRGKGVLDRFVVSEQRSVRRILGPAP